MSKIEIIPAILPRDYAELEEKVSLVKDLVRTIQIDICDGQFVQNATWPYRKDDITFGQLLSQEQGLPNWNKIDFEIDLMANRVEGIVEDWISVGATRIIVHAEMNGDLIQAINKMKDKVEIGLALNIETPLEKVGPFISEINFIQCMGIDNIGFQGQSFDREVIEKIKLIKNKYTDMIVSIDGGVSEDNAQALADAGADRLVVGSAIFNSENIIETIRTLRQVKALI